jgi:hypothetical protein
MNQHRVSPESAASEAAHLPPLRTDRVPEDVLATQDAEERPIDVDAEASLAYVSGMPEETLSELDASRTAREPGLESTDQETLELTDENYDRQG